MLLINLKIIDFTIDLSLKRLEIMYVWCVVGNNGAEPLNWPIGAFINHVDMAREGGLPSVQITT